VSTPRAIARLEGLGQLEKTNDLIGNGSRDFLACSIAAQLTALPDAGFFLIVQLKNDYKSKRHMGDLVEPTGHFFHKFGYSKYDVTPEIFLDRVYWTTHSHSSY
jgi:hypothetical protein